MFYMFPRIVKPEVCDKIVKDLLSNNLEPAMVGSPKNGLRDEPDIRKTSVYFVPTKIKSKANDIAWYFLKQANEKCFNYDLTLFENIQFAEYKNGGFYDWHQDSIEPDEKNNVRKLSLTFVLSDPNTFEGGELQFYSGGRPTEEPEQTKNDMKAQGSLIIFDSRDWHRVTPVTSGVRHSVVCWSLGQAFK